MGVFSVCFSAEDAEGVIPLYPIKRFFCAKGDFMKSFPIEIEPKQSRGEIHISLGPYSDGDDYDPLIVISSDQVDLVIEWLKQAKEQCNNG